MGITEFGMYVFGQVDTWLGCIGLFTCIFGATGFVMTMLYLAFLDGGIALSFEPKDFKKCLKRIWITFLILLSLILVLPNQKTIAMMYIVPKIANSEFLTKELPTDMKDVYTLAIKSLKDAITKEKRCVNGYRFERTCNR